jgi:hypothetical protein
VHITFFGAHASVSRAVALLVAATAGALVMAQDTGASLLPAPEIPALTPASLPAGAAVTAPLNAAPKTPAAV